MMLLGVGHQQALGNYIQAAVVDGGLGGTIKAADYPEGGEGRTTALQTFCIDSTHRNGARPNGRAPTR